MFAKFHHSNVTSVLESASIERFKKIILFFVISSPLTAKHKSQAMVSHGRVELLAHPLSQKYLQMKWNSYGKYFHVTNLFIYTVFLMFVTMYTQQLMTSIANRSSNATTVQNMSIENDSSVSIHRQNDHFPFFERNKFSFKTKSKFNRFFQKTDRQIHHATATFAITMKTIRKTAATAWMHYLIKSNKFK